METKRELRERVYITREACKWDASVDNILDYQAAVAAYNATVPIREHLKYPKGELEPMKIEKTQHTPGPWATSCDGKIRAKTAIRNKTGDYICSMPFSSVREADEMPEANANAALIAAAPELLAALEKAVPALQAANRLTGKWSDIVAEMCAAIAKAKAEGR